MDKSICRHCVSFMLLMYLLAVIMTLPLVSATGSDQYKNSVVTGSGQVNGSDEYLQSFLGTRITIKPGRHVCTAEKVVSRPVKVSQTYKRPVYTSHPRDCPNFTNCPQFDVKYETTNRTVFLLQKSSSFRHSCCPGWTKGHKREKGCMAPICTNGCGHFGVCTKPEVCLCRAGFTGDMCDTDIDECRQDGHGCHQICKNTAGSYMCACQTGFTLAVDGKTCNFCYTCQEEYTDLILSMETMHKQLADNILIQTEQIQLFKTQEETVVDKMKFMEQNIRNLTEENNRLQATVLDIRDKYDVASHEIERLQNITRTTEAPPTTSTTSQSTTSTESTTTETNTKAAGELEFRQEDLLYSLSNQIGMMEEKLELCNCHARRGP